MIQEQHLLKQENIKIRKAYSWKRDDLVLIEEDNVSKLSYII